MKFLIVDDSARWRRFMRNLFEEFGSITEACDGEDAVRVFAEENPDLVLMDISMKRMDGFAAARQIKNRCAGAEIIFVTQYADEEFRERAAGLGAGFIQKDQVQLLQELARRGSPHKAGTRNPGASSQTGRTSNGAATRSDAAETSKRDKDRRP